MASIFHAVPSRKLNLLLGLVFAAAIFAAGPSWAQGKDTTPPTQQKKIPEAPEKLPRVGADRTRGLDFLFGALKAPSTSRAASGRCGRRPTATRRCC
jgi:hypothetical protein